MKRSTLILSTLLVLSAAGNLAVVGMFTGHWLRGGGGGNNGSPPSGAERLMSMVPEPLRPEINQAMRPSDEEVKAHVEAFRAARRAVNDAMRQRPFDPARAEIAMAELRAVTGRVQEKLHHKIIERMAAAQADGTLPPPPERGQKGKPDKDGPPPPMPEPQPPPPPPGN